MYSTYTSLVPSSRKPLANGLLEIFSCVTCKRITRKSKNIFIGLEKHGKNVENQNK